jgi:DNA-binding MarR family transcriptional regulator
MSTDWDEIGYVISSTYRVKVLQRLADSPAPTSKIAEDTDCANSHISRALNDLRERGLVDLLVPESRKKGRIYGITDRGREVWETIEAQNLV